MIAYTDEDFQLDNAPLSDIITEQSQFVLPERDKCRYYLIRIELLSHDRGSLVIRKGDAIMCPTGKGIIDVKASVLLNHRQRPAVGSVVSVSDDRRFLEQQLQALEEHARRSQATFMDKIAADRRKGHPVWSNPNKNQQTVKYVFRNRKHRKR